MSPIETIFCSQYYELKKGGRDAAKGRLNATILTSVLLMMLLAGFLIILTYFVPHNPIAAFLKSATRAVGYSRWSGKLLGVGCAAILGLIVWLTFGSKTNYERMAVGWDQLPDAVLQKTIRKSLYIFFILFGFFLATTLLLLI
ncbi:MAG: hypothetical protein ABIX01_16270 [Chitinophagaceae bacterium]